MFHSSDAFEWHQRVMCITAGLQSTQPVPSCLHVVILYHFSSSSLSMEGRGRTRQPHPPLHHVQLLLSRSLYVDEYSHVEQRSMRGRINKERPLSAKSGALWKEKQEKPLYRSCRLMMGRQASLAVADVFQRNCFTTGPRLSSMPTKCK